VKKPQYKSVTDAFEALYATYIAKLKRHDELVAAGRYGYQLRMPARAIGNAKDALREFGKQNNVEVESLFNSQFSCCCSDKHFHNSNCPVVR